MRLLPLVLLGCLCSSSLAGVTSQSFTEVDQTPNPADPYELNSTFMGGAGTTITNPFPVSGFSFSDGSVTVSYDVLLRLNWAGPAAGTQTGLPSDSNTGLGGITDGVADSGQIEDLSSLSVDAVEILEVSVINVNPNLGSVNGIVNSIEFTSATVEPELNITTTLGSMLTAQAVAGNNGGKLTAFNIDFDVSAIPEPSQWAMLGLLGVLFGGRRWWRKRSL